MDCVCTTCLRLPPATIEILQPKALRDGSFKDLLARGRILFLKLNNFSTNRHINSLPTLPFSPKESKPGK